jgi:serine/threonine-protein kinase
MLGANIGKYRIIRQISEGGMGTIYEAVHESIGQRAAVKVLFARFAAEPQYVECLFDEARAVNIVKHAGLVKTYDFGTLSGVGVYILMEYLEGESLNELLVERQELTVPLGDALVQHRVALRLPPGI